MKRFISLLLILGIVGCSNKDTTTTYKPPIIIEDEEEKPYEPKTIIKEEKGELRHQERGSYQLVYDDEVSVTIKDDFVIDYTILKLDNEEQLITDLEAHPHFSGEFRYTYNNDNYIVKFDTVSLGIFYSCKGENWFELTAEDNELRYWIYTKKEVTLIVNKVWKFIPTEGENN